MDRYSLNMADKRGWRTQGNKQDMIQRGVASFNNRQSRILFPEFTNAAASYDREADKHTSDVLMAYFVTESITDADHPKGYGRQFAAMAARVRGYVPDAVRQAVGSGQQGWGRQAPKPFVIAR